MLWSFFGNTPHEALVELGLRPLRACARTLLSRLCWPVMLTLVFVAQAAFAQPLDLTPAERAWLAAHPVIRVGVDPGYAPYAFIDEQGRPAGVATELTALVAARLGVKLELVPGLQWPQILEGARQGQVDLITTAVELPERESYLNFSRVYLPTPLVVMTRTETATLRDLSQLNGLRVALVKSYSSSAQAMQRYPDMQVLEVANPLEGLRAVSDGRAQAYIGALGINTFTASRNGISNLKVNTGFDMSNGQRYGVRKDWPELVPLLEKALNAIPPSEQQAIFSRWISVSVDDIKSTSTTLDAAVLAQFAALPVLRVGVLPDRPPFDFFDANGRHVGLAADVLTTLSRHTGLKTQAVPGASVEQLLAQLSDGQLDLVLAVNGAMPGVPNELLSRPYLVSSLGVFVRKGDVFLGELSDLFDHRVAVNGGGYAQEMLRIHPRIALQPEPSIEASAQALLDKKVDYMVVETTSALRVVEDASILGLRYAGPLSQAPVRLSMAVSPRIAGLHELIDLGLDSVTAQEAADIRRHWVGAPLQGGITLNQVLRWALALALLVALGALAFYQWNRRLKRAVARQTRFYAALAATNEIMAHCSSPEELFPQVCRIAVELGGMQMAWIGLVDTDTPLVRPVASFGPQADSYLQGIEISVDASALTGQGPMGTAIRERRPFWCQDFQKAPNTGPWRERLARHGWKAAAALPLYQNHGVMGALTLYTDRRGIFDEDARRLLVNMTDNISFALDNLALAAEHQRNEALRQEGERQLRSFYELDLVGLAITSPQKGWVSVNQRLCAMLEYSEPELRQMTWAELTHPDDLAADVEQFNRVLANDIDGYSLEKRFVSRTGKVIPAQLVVRCVRNAGGEVEFVSAMVEDLTASKAALDEIQRLAFHDPLTGLPNRRLLMDRLGQALLGTARHHRLGALLMVDLDQFKDVNDTSGHADGDLMLQQVARRLSAAVREGDTVARIGGDEFIVLLDDLSANAVEAASQARLVGEKILGSLGDPYALSDGPRHSSASIGVTLFGEESETSADGPLRRADLAMYQAKLGGRNSLRFFDSEMQVVVSARASVEADLREAIAQHQLVLHYQAQVRDQHHITGVEALVRWQHPKRGMVSPADFIPLAEETGLILPLGAWVLEAACQQLTLWASQPGTAHLTIAVNVSARQFRQDDFVEQVMAVLARTGANARRLKLELTESLLVKNIDGVIVKMSRLRELGISFSLDDFGTGFSSLSYLKRLPLDQLKIDQGFVRDILVDANDAAIARMVVALADTMGLAVIAEGVESEDHRVFLAQMGCHDCQGYLFSKPLPIEAFTLLAQTFAANHPRSDAR